MSTATANRTLALGSLVVLDRAVQADTVVVGLSRMRLILMLSAFIIALFAEMYGFPLTIYLLSGWLGRTYPRLDLLSHDTGHLWSTLFGWKGDPHMNPLHLLSYVLLALGFLILASAWDVLYAAQRTRRLATEGPYCHVRHPQYDGFILILVGFLLQWPTLLTLVMFPILVAMYTRLARREEREMHEAFGTEYERYAAAVPAFVPRWRASTPATPSSPAHRRPV